MTLKDETDLRDTINCWWNGEITVETERFWWFFKTALVWARTKKAQEIIELFGQSRGQDNSESFCLPQTFYGANIIMSKPKIRVLYAQ